MKVPTSLLSVAAPCLLMLAVSSPFAIASPRAQLPADAVIVDALPPAAAAKASAPATQILASIAAGEGRAALQRLAMIDDVVQLEATADVVLDALRVQAPHGAAEPLLEWLSQRADRVHRRHEETAGDWYLPVFALAGRAEGTLEDWRRQRLREAWQAQLRHAPARALVELRDAEGDVVARAVEAVQLLDEAAIDGLAGALAADPAAAPLDLWQALVERQPAAHAIRHLLAHGQPRQRLVAVQATQALPADVAFDLLDEAAADPLLASAATLAIAALAAAHEPARDWLLHRLEDAERGPSVAAGLAGLPERGRVAYVAGLLGPAPSALRARHLALALRLEGSAEARAHLRQWASDERLPAELRGELQR